MLFARFPGRCARGMTLSRVKEVGLRLMLMALLICLLGSRVGHDDDPAHGSC